MFFYAILLGIGGSLHCVGMCGPLVMAVPAAPSVWLGRLLYHAGRISTYATMGAIMGGFGQMLSWATGQQYLSVAVGIAMLLVILLPAAFRGKLSSQNPLLKLSTRVRIWFGEWFKKRSYTAILVLGMLNGLLVCGMVYAALAAATATGSALGGTFFMALFGLANTPMLLGISEIKTWLPSSWQKQVQRWSGMLTATIAIVLILRGLNLGIPLLSPEVAAQDSGAPVKCNHR